MPEENRVFDVTKPSHVGATATSKPVIVGHHPTMSDPMVRDADEKESHSHTPLATKINIQDEPLLTHHDSPTIGDTPHTDEPADTLSDSSSLAPAITNDTAPETPFLATDTPAAGQSFPPEAKKDEEASFDHPSLPESPAEFAPEHPSHTIEGLHVGAHKKRRWPLWMLLIILILAGVYLAIDSGLVKSNINLPVHFFKQKTAEPAPSTPASSSNTATAPAVPTGFTKYKLADTNLTFAAPTAWGQPTSSAEPGYLVRGGTNTTSGTYAYLVNFATNKDVQIAVTSTKYLPAARAAVYYDFLQWCKGTNDSKFYKTILHFSTANKIDTPTTATCDQGPVADATLLDTSTIVQLKTTAPDGKTVLGDLYTKNLTDSNLVVFRIKDAAMTNSNDIKTLLGTVQLSSASSSSSSSSSSNSSNTP